MKIPSERFVWACFAFVLTGQAGFFCAARFGALTRCLCCHAVFASGLRKSGLRKPDLREPGMSDADSRKLSLSARLRHVCGRFAAETQLIRDRHVCCRRFCIQRACIQHAHS